MPRHGFEAVTQAVPVMVQQDAVVHAAAVMPDAQPFPDQPVQVKTERQV